MTATVLTTLIMMAVLGPSSAPVSKFDPAQHLTRNQVVMINNARTPEDHRELSRYFRQEAEQKRKKEQYYTEVAATYRLHPPRVDAYRNVSTADYYQHLADEARNAALADDQIAKLQDKLAEDMVQAK